MAIVQIAWAIWWLCAGGIAMGAVPDPPVDAVPCGDHCALAPACCYILPSTHGPVIIVAH